MKFNILLITLIVIALTSAFSFTGYYILSGASQEKTFTVTKVLDGDTIEIETVEKVRLLGINAPEKNEFYYQEAKDKLTELVEGKLVKLEAGPEDTDLYSRLLRYIFVGDTFVNLNLVKEGYATVYIISPDEKYYLELKEAEKEAKEGKLGLWGRSIESCIVIFEFNYDAAGNDNNNLNGEYVRFKNNCDHSVNFDGWTVKDSGTHVYAFGSFVLEPSFDFTLFSGGGVDTKSKIYWNSDKAIWNNGGDTLFLRDDKGNLVLSYSYP